MSGGTGLIFIVSLFPAVLSYILKEKFLNNTQVNEWWMNLWISIWQFIFGFVTLFFTTVDSVNRASLFYYAKTGEMPPMAEKMGITF